MLGHAVGDELIRCVALRLKGAVRASDTLSRNGGDEFVVLLSEVDHAEHAALGAEKIIAAVAAPHDVFGRKLRVMASVGIAVYPVDGANAEALKSADAAMYEVKAAGGNGYRFSTAGVSTAGVSTASAAPPNFARFDRGSTAARRNLRDSRRAQLRRSAGLRVRYGHRAAARRTPDRAVAPSRAARVARVARNRVHA